MHVQAALQVAAYYSELVLRDVQCRMVVFSWGHSAACLSIFGMQRKSGRIDS